MRSYIYNPQVEDASRIEGSSMQSISLMIWFVLHTFSPSKYCPGCIIEMSIMEAAETVAGCMGGEHDKAALEQLSKRRERKFKLD
jgi:hypothetical protein